jgi:hypothetical protein
MQRVWRMQSAGMHATAHVAHALCDQHIQQTNTHTHTHARTHLVLQAQLSLVPQAPPVPAARQLAHSRLQATYVRQPGRLAACCVAVGGHCCCCGGAARDEDARCRADAVS